MSIETRPNTTKPFTGRKMLALLIGFFAVVTAVNGIFITVALRTFPGMTEANPYQTGLDYNRVLEAAEALRALGWRLDVTVENRQPAVFSLRIVDEDGRPVDGVDVAATLRRPSDKAEDRDLVLDQVGSGTYQMKTPALAEGNWDVVLHLARPDGSRFTVERRIWVKS